jgi:monovalent cation:proton antiporter-2 (CPA2) family protein
MAEPAVAASVAAAAPATVAALSLIGPLMFLAAAVVAVPLFRRLGLGSVLGYLVAGVALGPSVLGLVREPQQLMDAATLGIVLLLFLIGLDLKLSRLWSLRRDIFGLGSAQIVVSAALLIPYPLLEGRDWPAALVAGLGLALSSTPLVMQLLDDRGDTDTPYGRKAFAVLLMQDLAIVPLLALVAFLSPAPSTDARPVWLMALATAGGVTAVILTGRFLLNPLFAVLARAGAREIMTAAALLVVFGAATLMSLVGVSMAMGSFLAGVMLAESSYRHELEADIEPFRGLLLGLFFMSVGMSLDPGVVVAHWPALLAGVLALLALKSAALYGLMRAFGSGHNTSVRAGLLLAQGGEFGFVLYTTAAAAGVMTREHAGLLMAVVTLSMALMPGVVALGPRLLCRQTRAEPEESFDGAAGRVLVIGFGRFGQLVTQVLLAGGVRPVIIDKDVTRIEEAARFGARVYYGDGTRLDVLRAAGADRVELIAVCTDTMGTTDRIIDVLNEQMPATPRYVRSYDRRHSLRLIDRGIDFEIRETLESALAFGREALVGLGMPREEATDVEADVRHRDRERLEAQRTGGLFASLGHYRIRPEPLPPGKKRR